MKGEKNSILILLFLAFTLQIFSQNFWEELYFPDSVTIQCITTNDLGHIFIGTGYDAQTGGLYRSTDNGLSWDLVLDCGTFGVLSVDINDNGYIYVGKNGFERFVVSKDNGDTWEEVSLPPPSYGNIVKIFCKGQDTILLSSWETEGSFIMKTTDSGQTWEPSFVTDHQNEYVSDIAVNNNGDIYVSCDGFFFGQGGVYKSENFGNTWEYVGLLNHQVMTIEINSNNDVFTGDWWMMNNDTPGIYALYEGSTGFELLVDAYNATDIVISSENIIYATANEDVIRSFDNGQTWEIIEDVLSSNTEFLQISFNGYLYGIRFDRIIKSINPITGIGTNINADIINNLTIYPNPVNDILNVRLSVNTNNNIAGTVGIYKLTGELILRFNISKDYGTEIENCLQINTGNLSNGIYILKYNTGNELFISKFIKK